MRTCHRFFVPSAAYHGVEKRGMCGGGWFFIILAGACLAASAFAQTNPGAPVVAAGAVEPSAPDAYKIGVFGASEATNSYALQLTPEASSGTVFVTSHPQSVSVLEGDQAVFTVGATGVGTLSYQWKKNGDVIPGATSSVLVVDPVSVGGSYTVEVSDSTPSTVTSNAAQLTVRTQIQGGDVDFDFVGGSVVSGAVSAIAQQADGRLIIAGLFTSVHGAPRGRVARLNVDGSIDHTFGNGLSGADASVSAVSIQGDGKILIAGSFVSVNGTPINRIARLNADGTLDTTFGEGLSLSALNVSAIVWQSDGKILVGGGFTSINGSTANRIARLNSDGSLDTTFGVGLAGANSSVRTICLQPDGKILIGGDFTTVNGNSVVRTARLNSDGSLDGTFGVGFTGASASVNSIALQTDGKVVIGGVFTTVNGAPRGRIARLQADGALDTGFGNGLSGASSTVSAVLVQADGKVRIGGTFTSVNGTTRAFMARLNGDGTLDSTHNASPNSTVNAMVLENSGSVVIGGVFSLVNGVVRQGVARIGAGGGFDSSLNNGLTGLNNRVLALGVQSDQKILIGGNFTKFNATTINRIARLHPNGTPDLTFASGLSGASSTVNALALQSDGKVVIGGFFSTVHSVVRSRVARLNSNGTLDTGFASGLVISGAAAIVNAVAVQPDGKVLVAGDFTSVGGQSLNRIARLNGDGSVDTSFGVGLTGASATVRAMALQSDGKVLIGGDFTTVNGVSRSRFARLNSDGSLDAGFGGTLANSLVFSIAVQSDGKILVGGNFTLFNSVARGRLARLNADGTLDATFGNGLAGPSAIVRAIVPRNDGSILVGGDFTTVNGTNRGRIALLDSSGEVMASFGEGLSGAADGVFTVAEHDSDKVLIGGSFGAVNGSPRSLLTRLWLSAPTLLSTDASLASLTLSSGPLSPVFSSDTTSYSATVPFGTSSVTLVPTSSNANASIEVRVNGGGFSPVVSGAASGALAMNVGTNTIEVKVTSEAATTLEIYSIEVTREAPTITIVAPPQPVNVLLGDQAIFTVGAVGAGTLNYQWRKDSVAIPGATADTLIIRPALLSDAGLYSVDVTDSTPSSISSSSVALTVRSNPVGGDVDFTFKGGTSVNNSVVALGRQTDGKIVIGGNFTGSGGVPRGRVARLNLDGSTDHTFGNGLAGANGTVNAVAVQPDGKILIGGAFSSVNDVPRGRIARLNADGTLDAAFAVGQALASSTVSALVIQNDGRILVGGFFTTLNGTVRSRIARLNEDGTLDATFGAGQTLANNSVSAMAVQSDGKVVVVGAFTTMNGTARNRVARLNSDGSLDADFGSGQSLAAGTVSAIGLQPDGKILVGGVFTTINGVSQSRIARLNNDGSFDGTFDPSQDPNNSVLAIVVQDDGRILVGGAFTQSSSTTSRTRIQRFNADGSLDSSFGSGQIGAGPNGQVNAVILESGGRVVIGGVFTAVSGAPAYGVARLNADGIIDGSLSNGTDGPSSTVTAVVVQPDGKTIVAGGFNYFDGESRNRITRLNEDGSVDAGFGNALSLANGTVNCVALQPDAKIILGGGFSSVNGVTRGRIARLNPDGSLDSAFGELLSGFDLTVNAVALQNDGKVIAGGVFSTLHGVSRSRIARLNADGSMDTSFGDGLAGANNTVSAIALQSDGQILVGGSFTSINGASINRIARLNGDGSLDATFGAGLALASGTVLTIAVQGDGKVLIGGTFSTVNGISRSRIARLNSDGSVDTSFGSGLSLANNSVNGITLQSDGKILVGGVFTTFNSTNRGGIVRLNSDGSLDATFGAGLAGVLGSVSSVAVASDGKVLIGGLFGGVNGAAYNGVARLWGTEPVELSHNADLLALSLSDGVLAPSFSSGTRTYSASVTSGISGITVTPTVADGNATVSVEVNGGGYSGVLSGNASSLLPIQVGANTVDVRVLAEDGISAGVYSILVTREEPAVAIVSDPQAVSVLPGGLAVFTVSATGTAPLSYQWKKGATPIPGANSPFLEIYPVSVGDAGDYSVDVTNSGPPGVTLTSAAAALIVQTVPRGGDVDFSFAGGAPVNGNVNAVALQTDGKALIGGLFTSAGGAPRGRIVRLNLDGSIDHTFGNGLPQANGAVNAIAVQSDGKILIGGGFSEVNGTAVFRVARLNIDGTLDESFAVGMSGPSSTVNSLAVQDDGKVVIGGFFTTVNGTARSRVARLLPDGSLDSTFAAGLAGTDNTVTTVAVQADGRVLIGGSFSNVHGSAASRIARLNDDGTLDASFGAGLAGASSTVNAITVQSDNRILVGGDFSSFHSVSRGRVARLNSDGTLDSTFAPGQTLASLTVNAVGLRIDGKVIIAGSFLSVSGALRGRLAVLNANGSLDSGFGSGLSGADNTILALASQSDGKVVIGGAFFSVNGTLRNRVARLDTDGTLDAGYDTDVSGFDSGVLALALQNDGKILAGGTFSRINGVSSVTRIARLNSDGSPDAIFGAGLAGANATVNAVGIQSDGKVLIGGAFSSLHGTAVNRIARLNGDGSLDTSFATGLAGATSSVNVIAIQGDDKVLIGGDFTSLHGTAVNRIARLNSDGSLDAGFASGLAGANLTVHAIAVQGDGKILIAGSFTTVNGTSANRIARLNSDGTLDAAFGSGLAGASATVYAVAVQGDGKVLIAGAFTTVNGVPRNRVARLESDGSLDGTFGEGLSGADNTVRSMVSQPNGLVLIGGDFASVNGSPRGRIARMNTFGSLDTSFGDGLSGANSTVLALALQSDGQVIIGGAFGGVNGQPRASVARLHAESPPSLAEISVFNGVSTAPGDEREDNVGVFSVGSVPTGSGSVVQTFTIQNTGTEDLEGLSVTSSNHFEFLVGALGSVSLAPNEVTTFTVLFSTNVQGLRSAEITVASNDADEDLFQIQMEGSGATVGTINLPERMYYRFDGSGTTVPNFASAPVGANPATILGTHTQGGSGQFGGGLVGGGLLSSNYLNTGWATALSGSWTISLYVDYTSAALGPNFLFGDSSAGSLQCSLSSGTTKSLSLAGLNMNVVSITNLPGSGAFVIHFVYDSLFSHVRVYINGELAKTVHQSAPVNFVGAGPFKVGGYLSGMLTGSIVDEFRMYDRALASGEVAASWNVPLPWGSEIVVFDGAGTSGAEFTDNVGAKSLGVVNVGDTGAAQTFTIQNIGLADLTSISVSSSNSTEFTVGGAPASALAGGGSTSFTVNFTPSAPGHRSSIISIASSDTDENPFEIQVTGVGGVPSIGLVPVASASGDIVSGAGVPDATGADSGAAFDLLKRGGFLGQNGMIVFPGELLIGSGSPPVTAVPNTFMGVWKDDGTGVKLLARSGDLAPQADGAVFDILPQVPAINDSGEVTILASLALASGSPPVTLTSDTGLWSELGGSGLQLLLREDDLLPVTPAGTRVASFASGAFATAHTGATTGEAAFCVTMKGGSTDTAVLRASVDTNTVAVAVVARQNTLAPGTSQNFGVLNGAYTDSIRMDATGNLVFVALLNSPTKEGIWYQAAGSATEKLFVAGEPAPGTNGATFRSIKSPSIGSAGVVAFRGQLNNDGDNSAGLRNDGIWRGDTANGFAPILWRGASAIAGMPANSKVGNVWGGWLNNANHGAWRAWLDVNGNGVSAAADGDVHAIFTDIGGSMEMSVKVGDPAPGIAGATFVSMDLPVVGSDNVVLGSEYVAFIGKVAGAGIVQGNNDQGVWRKTGVGTFALVMRTGTTITTTEGVKMIQKVDLPGSGFAERRWEQPVMDNTGRLLIYVKFTDGSTSQILAP